MKKTFIIISTLLFVSVCVSAAGCGIKSNVSSESATKNEANSEISQSNYESTISETPSDYFSSDTPSNLIIGKWDLQENKEEYEESIEFDKNGNVWTNITGLMASVEHNRETFPFSVSGNTLEIQGDEIGIQGKLEYSKEAIKGNKTGVWYVDNDYLYLGGLTYLRDKNYTPIEHYVVYDGYIVDVIPKSDEKGFETIAKKYTEALNNKRYLCTFWNMEGKYLSQTFFSASHPEDGVYSYLISKTVVFDINDSRIPEYGNYELIDGELTAVELDIYFNGDFAYKEVLLCGTKNNQWVLVQTDGGTIDDFIEYYSN